jgi:hypothetical protein
VHLGLGAVAIPDGLAVIQGRTKLLPFILHVGIPHWQPPRHRHPVFANLCDKDNKKGCPPMNPGNISPKLETNFGGIGYTGGHNYGQPQNCTYGQKFHDLYDNFLHDLIEQYGHLVDTKFYATLLKTVCSNHPNLCTHPESEDLPDTQEGETTTPSEEEGSVRRSNREKRFFGLIGSFLGLASLGLGSINAWQIHSIKSTMGDMDQQLQETRHTLNMLNEGVGTLNSKVDAIQSYLHEESMYLWRSVERLRCQTALDTELALQEITLNKYENYLRRSVEAAVQGALTGQLTPGILGPKHLRTLLTQGVA